MRYLFWRCVRHIAAVVAENAYALYWHAKGKLRKIDPEKHRY